MKANISNKIINKFRSLFYDYFPLSTPLPRGNDWRTMTNEKLDERGSLGKNEDESK